MLFDFFKKKRNKNPNNDKNKRVAFTGYDYRTVTTLQISTAYACIKVIAESIAMLPLKIYMEKDGEKHPAIGHPLFDLFEYGPNPNESPTEFKENLALSLIMHGNVYCYIERNGIGHRITALWTIPYQNMQVDKMTDGSIRYRWYDLNNKLQEANSYDEIQKIWHIKLFSTDGVKGVSPIEQLKDTFKQAGMTDQFWTQFLENGCNLSGKIKIEDSLDEEAFNSLKKRIEETYSGSKNIGKIMYLENGMDFSPINNNSLADSQFIETKKYIMRQIASIFKVPLHMIGIMEASTYNNVEQQQIFFLIHCLGPYLRKIEEKVLWLLDKDEKSSITAKFLTTSLLKMDTKSRYDVYKKGVETGILSTNECRTMEDMPSYIGGDVHLVPLNMAYINEQGQIERIVETQTGNVTETTDKLNVEETSKEPNSHVNDPLTNETDEEEFTNSNTGI